MLRALNNAWQPTAELTTLRQRAQIIACIRAFFAARDIWEVETPLLGRHTVTAPHLHSLSLNYQQQCWYLQTSPEYAMKRLLAAGSGAIYQLGKAFRADEVGKLHAPEFSLLEWYRPHFNHHQLMDEVDVLLQTILNSQAAERISYADLFKKFLTIDPHTIAIEDLKKCAERQHLNIQATELTHDDWLQLLLTHCIEPHLGFDAPLFIYDFPVLQAALAKIRVDNPPVAERFEVYVQGVELANGYHELTDAIEQRARFKTELMQREALGYPTIPLDEYLLAALPHLPPCAGVALGIDRLIMLALQQQQISEVLAFTQCNH